MGRVALRRVTVARLVGASNVGRAFHGPARRLSGFFFGGGCGVSESIERNAYRSIALECLSGKVQWIEDVAVYVLCVRSSLGVPCQLFAGEGLVSLCSCSEFETPLCAFFSPPMLLAIR